MKIRTFCLLILTMLIICSCEKEYNFEENGVLVPLTVTESPSHPSITINGVQLHSESFGIDTATMIVVIHGGPGADYRSLLNYKQLVSDDFFVVFYDQRGSGLSERIDASKYANIQSYIDELDGVIKHYRQSNTQKVILAGHSWGAMLATAYINQKPNDIEGVILSEPGGFTWNQTLSYFEKARPLKLFDELTNDFVYQDQFITGADHNTLDYKLALSTAGDVTTGDVESAPYWRFGAICNSASIELAMTHPEQLDFTSNLSQYTTKVLFAYSELNPAYGIEHAQLVSSALPNVELVEIQNCGHEIPYFGWDNFYPVIKDYLIEIL